MEYQSVFNLFLTLQAYEAVNYAAQQADSTAVNAISESIAVIEITISLDRKKSRRLNSKIR